MGSRRATSTWIRIRIRPSGALTQTPGGDPPIFRMPVFSGTTITSIYGVVPAAFLMLPYSVLTGSELSLNAATLFFTLLGLLFSFRTYRRAQAAYFPRVGPVIDSLNVLLLAFASLAPVLVKCSGVYELAVASGYCLDSAGIYFLLRHLQARTRGLRWIGLASLSFGLAVGCRPNLILVLPVVAVAAVIVRLQRMRARRESGSTGESTGLAAWFAAWMLPACVVGAVLAWYNYARFGSILEFGFDYGMNAFIGTGRPIASLSFAWSNLRWYYLTPPIVTANFPYCYSINAAALPPGYFSPEAIHGQCIVGILLLVSICLAVAANGRGPATERRIPLFLALLGWMFVSELAFMVLLGVRADRYMTDFQAPLVMMIALGAGHAASELPGLRPGPLLLKALYCASAIAAILYNFFVGLEIFNNFEYRHPIAYKALARLGDYPVIELWKHGYVDYVASTIHGRVS